jgi:dihydroxyacetone kinase-like predicted kinase
MSDKKIISVKESLEAVTLDTFRYADGVGKKSFATIFYGENIADEYVGFLTEKVKEVSSDIEVSSMSTNETLYSLMIAFE